LKSKIDGSTSSWTTGSVRMLDVSITDYTPLSSEITKSPTTSTYDGYIQTTTPQTYTNGNFVTPPANIVGNSSFTLVYFYNQQPH
jgi:hypothetical protein